MRIRIALVIGALFTLVATASANAAPGGNGGTFPGKGNGVDGTPGKNGTPGTFPGGGATNGIFSGGGKTDSGGGVVSASEPLALLITGLGLVGASLILRKR